MGWIESKDRFINPYNFVSLEDNVTRDNIEKGNLTGVIKCTLTTRSPIFIPNTENVKFDLQNPKHKVYEFFSHSRGDEAFQPVIPASELRGLIRSAYETVTNSCLSALDDLPITARTPRPKDKGIIYWENGMWVLYEAVERSEESKAEAVFLQGELTPPPKGKKIGNRNEYYFIKKESASSYYGDIVEKAVKNLREVLELYRDPKKNLAYKKRTHKGYPSYKITKDKPFAVWYEFVDEKLYLAPACISRTAFYNTLGTAAGDYAPCNEKDNMCKACSLFGMLGKKDAVSSKIRFSDGVATNFENDKYMNKITLAELASPRKSAVEFYTTLSSDAKVWNYDFKTVGYEGIKDGKHNLPEYENINKGELRIRGRKYYWHSGEILTQKKQNEYNKDDQPKLENERNVTVRPIDEGVNFSFDVYYNNITKQQLMELLWVLTIGDNTINSNLCYKIGMGKPLGLGSVKIKVDSEGVIQRRLTLKENSIEYVVPKGDDIDNLVNSFVKSKDFCAIKEKKYFREFLEICNVEALKKYTDKGIRVCYPCGDDGKGRSNSTAGHQWFLGNKSMIKSIFEAEFSYTLPKILDPYDGDKKRGVSLPKLIQIEGQKPSDNANTNSSKTNGGDRNRVNNNKQSKSDNIHSIFGDKVLKLDCSVCKKKINLSEEEKDRFFKSGCNMLTFKCQNCSEK